MAKERIREHKGQQTPSNLKNPEKTEENKKEYQRRVHVCMYVCMYVYVCVCVCVCVCVVTWLCLTLCDSWTVCSPPGSSVHGISEQEYWSGLPFPSL